MTLSVNELQSLSARFDPSPHKSFSLPAKTYLEAEYLGLERKEMFQKSWQYVCHIEALKENGSYITLDIQGQSIAVLRDDKGNLRAFYNVCRHKAHELLEGKGKIKTIVCPYHAWCYDLKGDLYSARHTDTVENFDFSDFSLMPVQIEEFCSMIWVNLDPNASSLAEQSGNLKEEILSYAPDIGELTHAHRLTYNIKANWKSVVDNFLECYHCAVAHQDFVSLVDMDNYVVTTQGIYSSHIAPAGKSDNSAYSVDGASVQDHAVWWLWPNTCLLRYPGAANWMVWRFIPVSEDITAETFDFFFEEDTPNEAQMEAIKYIDEILQKEDIDIVESVQRGMNTPAYEEGRYVCDIKGSGASEHAVHHFHSLYLEAIGKYIENRTEETPS